MFSVNQHLRDILVYNCVDQLKHLVTVELRQLLITEALYFDPMASEVWIKVIRPESLTSKRHSLAVQLLKQTGVRGLRIQVDLIWKRQLCGTISHFVDPRSARENFTGTSVNDRNLPVTIPKSEYRWISPGMKGIKDCKKWKQSGSKYCGDIYTIISRGFSDARILFAGVIVSDILNPGFWNHQGLAVSAEFRILSPDRGTC